jgi:hypothetical protein
MEPTHRIMILMMTLMTLLLALQLLVQSGGLANQ